MMMTMTMVAWGWDGRVGRRQPELGGVVGGRGGGCEVREGGLAVLVLVVVVFGWGGFFFEGGGRGGVTVMAVEEE